MDLRLDIRALVRLLGWGLLDGLLNREIVLDQVHVDPDLAVQDDKKMFAEISLEEDRLAGWDELIL